MQLLEIEPEKLTPEEEERVRALEALIAEEEGRSAGEQDPGDPQGEEGCPAGTWRNLISEWEQHCSRENEKTTRSSDESCCRACMLLGITFNETAVKEFVFTNSSTGGVCRVAICFSFLFEECMCVVDLCCGL